MQGKLKTTDPIAKFFPNAPADKKAITLHQLLTHTAGLRSDYATSDYEPYARDVYMQRIFDAPLLSRPGETFRYANSGYSMLAAIVEIASGQPYERYLYDNLFEPAGMTMTGYQIPKFPAAKIPRGYQGESDWGTIFERPWAPDGPWWELRGNGGIHSTAMDMYRWHQALQSGMILSTEATAKYQTGYINEGPMGQSKYAYGWSVSQSPAGKLIEHNGGNRVFSGDFLRYVDAGVIVIVFSNTSRDAGPDSAIPWPASPSASITCCPPKRSRSPPPNWPPYAGTYADAAGAKITVAATLPASNLPPPIRESWGLLQTAARAPADLVKQLNERTLRPRGRRQRGFRPTKAAFGGQCAARFRGASQQMW